MKNTALKNLLPIKIKPIKKQFKPPQRYNKRAQNNTSIISKNDKILISVISFIIFLGSFIGSIYGVKTDTTDEILIKYAPALYNSENLYIVSIFTKNIKYIIALWICGFFECGWGFNGAITIFWAFSKGNISSKVIQFLGNKGILYSALSIIPNIFTFTSIMLVSFFSFQMVMKGLSKPVGKMNLRREKHKIYTEYFIILSVCIIMCFISSIFEFYIIPLLF